MAVVVCSTTKQQKCRNIVLPLTNWVKDFLKKIGLVAIKLMITFRGGFRPKINHDYILLFLEFFSIKLNTVYYVEYMINNKYGNFTIQSAMKAFELKTKTCLIIFI